MTTQVVGSFFEELTHQLHLNCVDPGLLNASRLGRFCYEPDPVFLSVNLPGPLPLDSVWEHVCSKGYLLADEVELLQFAVQAGFSECQSPPLIAAGTWRESRRFGTMVACLHLNDCRRSLYLIPWQMIDLQTSHFILRPYDA